MLNWLSDFSFFFEESNEDHGFANSAPGSWTHDMAGLGHDNLVHSLQNLTADSPKGRHIKAEFAKGFKYGATNPDDERRVSSISAHRALPTSIVIRIPIQLFRAEVSLRSTQYKPTRNTSVTALPKPELPVRSHSEEPPRTRSSTSTSLARSGEGSISECRPAVSSPPKTSTNSNNSSSGGMSITVVMQCSGRTVRNNRCKRKVKVTLQSNGVDAKLPTELFCSQHPKAVDNKQTDCRHVVSCQTTSKNSPSGGTSNKVFIQCSGTTVRYKRCKNMVNVASHLNSVDPELPSKAFCHHHGGKKTADNKRTGFYLRGSKDKWVKYSDYIPSYLHPDTQADLRAEMERPPTEKDEPGYIYVIEIRDPEDEDLLKLKVGRTTLLSRRLNAWQNQCRSKEQVLRAFWPGNIAADDDETTLIGRVKVGQKGALCHKLERLVHLELSDLVMYAPYLDQDFPDAAVPSAGTPGSNPGVPTRNGKRGGLSSSTLKCLQQGSTPCQDCGTIHKEIFPLIRPTSGPYKGRELDKLVKPIIRKWGWFVAQLLEEL